MANLNKALNRNFLNSVFPTFGTSCKKTYIWNRGYQMFAIDGYTSKAGNQGCTGIRFSGDIAFVQHIGLYHTWQYLNGLELYARNGDKWTLVEKRDKYDKVFLDDDFIRSESTEMLTTYLTSTLGIHDMKSVAEEANKLLKDCYTPEINRETNYIVNEIVESLINE